MKILVRCSTSGYNANVFVWRKLEPKGSKVNKSGPKKEPWGIPQVIGAAEEEKLPILTEKDPFTVLTRRQTTGPINKYYEFQDDWTTQY